LLITKRVDIRVIGKTSKNYLSFGYKFKNFDIINVDVNHLSKGSHCRIDVKCDYCGKIFSKEYKNFINQREQSFTKKDCCSTCIPLKNKETNLVKYGCANPMDRDDVKDKLKSTILEKYGYEYLSQSPEIKKKISKTWQNKSKEEIKIINDKIIKTNIERYGHMYYLQTDEGKEKLKNTCLDRYGVEYPNQSEVIRKKYRDTCTDKYGVSNYFATDIFKKYIKEYWITREGFDSYSKTDLFKNRISYIWKNRSEEKIKNIVEKTKKTCLEKYGVECPLNLESSRKKLTEVSKTGSSQQTKVFIMLQNMYGESNVISDFHLGSFDLDIVVSIDNIDIDVEYDGWYWHSFEKDNIRDKFVKSKGFKVLRIKSGKKIPDEKIIFDNINELLNKDILYNEIILEDWNEERYMKGGRK